jgi:integrase/recombinase XerD
VDVETLTTKSIKELCAQLCAVSLKHEYTLIFDDVTRITPTAVNALEKLRNHFHIIAAARELPLRLGTWLTNFQKIELKPLSRAEAVELIIRASEDYRDKIEDFESYKNHVWNTTNGIPQFITETVNRFRKEGFISAQRVTSFRHTAALKEVDFTPFLLVFIGGIVVIKYLGKEAQEEDKGAFMLFGSIATVVLLFGRFFYNKAKRKFV